MKRTIIVGLGNPIISDDSVGVKVAQNLRGQVSGFKGVDVVEVFAGGLRLMDVLVGYDKAIIIDAMINESGKPGEIRKFGLKDLMATRNVSSSHDMDLNSALEVGFATGLKLPKEISIWGIEAEDVFTFSEELTSEVRKAVPIAESMIMKELASS